MSKGTERSGGITTALIYTRVSSDDQAREGVSLDAQLAACRRYAAEKGWALGTEYQDVLSGKRDDRPQYQALLASVRRLRSEGRSVAVVVARLDRFGRRLLERVRAREELKALGVPTHSVREGGEVSDLVANILASVAEEEVRQLGERVAGAMRHVAAGGWRVPRHTPWGYRFRPSTEQERGAGAPMAALDRDPVTAPFVREAFERVAAGESVRSVGRWVSGLPASARGDKALGYRQVRRLLSGSVYVARSEADANPDVLARARGRWEPLVSDETWAAVQRRIAGHRRMPRQASGAYLLTGLLRCPRCGARMNGGGAKNGGPKRRYECKGDQAGAAAPVGRCGSEVTTDLIDGPLLAEIEPLVAVVASTPELEAAIRRAWRALQRPKGDETGTLQRIQGLEHEGAKAKQRLTSAAVLLVDGTIDKAGYERLRDKAQTDLEAADAELARLRGRQDAASPALPPIDEILRQVGGWGVVLGAMDVPAKREVLSILVEHVVPQRLGYGRYEAAIAWTATGDLLRALVMGTQETAA